MQPDTVFIPMVWSGGQEDDAHSRSQQWQTLVHGGDKERSEVVQFVSLATF